MSVQHSDSGRARAYIEQANRKTRDAIAKLEMQKRVLRQTELALQQKNRELNTLLDAIKGGRVDTLYGASTESGAISIQDAGLVTENEKLMEELKRSNQKFRQVFELSYDGIAIIDSDGNILDANLKAEEMWRCSRAAILELKITNFPSLNSVGKQAGIFAQFQFAEKNTHTDSAKPSQPNAETEPLASDISEVRLDDGRIVEMSMVSIKWDGQSVYLATLHDITLRKQSENKLIQLAQYDQLTGLANRNYCLEYLLKVLARAKRHQGYIAVLFLDLDKFKDINDSLGHDEGDRLLKSVAERLSTCIRQSDLAARFGGDEFALILDEIKQPEDAGVIAQKILDTMQVPHLLNSKSIVTACSIGIATYPLCGTDSETLFKAADIAMFHAKAEGRHQYHYFAEEMQQQLQQRIHIEKDLRDATQLNEFMLYYQPQVDVSSGNIVAMEALLRWQHAEQGLISPDQFIPVAEKAGLIIDIGEWVLRTACSHIQTWQNDHHITTSAHPLCLAVAVNVSIAQLKYGGFNQKLKQILQDTGFAASLLELELTESTMMDDPKVVAAQLKEIRQGGIDIAVDDFGTGYSSLSYLHQLSLSTLKIDKTFVAEIGNNQQSEMIIKTIIGMAHNLDLRVVAEGVETIEQVDFLYENKCDLMQGYYFARPMPFEQATLLLKQGLTVEQWKSESSAALKYHRDRKPARYDLVPSQVNERKGLIS